MIEFILEVQALNLSKGSDIERLLVFNFQPSNIFSSSSAASAVSFESETRFTLVIGSSSFVGHPIVWRAKSVAAYALFLLLFISTATVVRSSM